MPQPDEFQTTEAPADDRMTNLPPEELREIIRFGKRWGPINTAIGWIAAVTAVPLGLLMVAEGFVSLTWPGVPGQITSSRINGVESTNVSVRRRKADKQTKYHFDVRYRYTVDGQSYTGDRLWHRLGPTNVSRESIAAKAKPYPTGAKVTVYHSWLRPQMATLERGPTIWDFLIFLGGGAMAATGIIAGRSFRQSARDAAWELEIAEEADELERELGLK